MKFLIAATCFVALSHASSPPTAGPIELRALRLELSNKVPDTAQVEDYITAFNTAVSSGGLDTASEPQKTINIILCQIANDKAVSTHDGVCGAPVGGDKMELARREIQHLIAAVESIRPSLGSV
jgi:hypothetical protein